MNGIYYKISCYFTPMESLHPGLLCHRPGPLLSIKGSGFELSETLSEHLSIHWGGKILGQYQLAYDSSSKERSMTPTNLLQLLDPTAAITKGAGGHHSPQRHFSGLEQGENRQIQL